jgi:hypothetical protein
MPEDYVMVARVAVFMRGLGTFLQHPISIAKAWRPLAVEVLKEKETPPAYQYQPPEAQEQGV